MQGAPHPARLKKNDGATMACGGHWHTTPAQVKTEILSQNEYPAKFLALLNSPHEGQTHCIQLVVEKEQDIETFNAKYLVPFQEFISTSHHGKAFIFDSIMKYL